MMIRLTPLFLVLAAALGAQDIHLGPPAWLAIEDLPDELPVVRGMSDMYLSSDQKAVNEPAYVEFRVSVSAKGEVVEWAVATSSPWLAKSFHAPARSFVPAKREGKPVASEIALFYIYNPAGASATGPDATPRLLAVQPPVYPESELSSSTDDKLVRVRAEIDEQGTVKTVAAVGGAGGAFAPAAVAAVKAWRFAPARKGGRAVSGSVELSVAFQPPAIFRQGEVHVGPKPVKRDPPVYPYTLRRLGISGQVELAFTITVEGRVADISVISASHPAFEERALNTVRDWRYTPAEKDGRPVAMAAVQLLEFVADERGVQEFKITVPTSWPPAVPEALRFDVAPKLEQMVLPVYPPEDLLAGRKGKVTLAYVVGPDGRVVEASALPGAPSASMAAAAVAALSEWKFIPPGRQGKPGHALLRIDIEFSPDGNSGHVPVTEGTQRILRRLKSRGVTDFATQAALDVNLVMRKGDVVVKGKGRGNAVIEFVIDRNGVPQLPRIVSATNDALGYAAVQAVSQWRFARPLARGKVVEPMVRFPVKFE